LPVPAGDVGDVEDGLYIVRRRMRGNRHVSEVDDADIIRCSAG
jgi:hypothetical protein